MKRNKDKYNEIIMECYVQLFSNSEYVGKSKLVNPNTPPDFKQMMSEATTNKFGQKEIPYNDYEIEEKLFDQIVDGIIKNNNTLKLWEKRVLKHSVLLGCSPKFKI